jgi:mono/diheme cytochrome c family protein
VRSPSSRSSDLASVRLAPRMRRLLPLAALVLALAGCGGGTVVAPVPETVIGTVAQGPSGAAAGKMLFVSNGCGGCHTYKPAGSNGKIGPDLDNLAADAKKANRGSLDQYARESITDPNAYVVSGYPKGVMPSFKGTLTDSQINDLVTFLTKP